MTPNMMKSFGRKVLPPALAAIPLATLLACATGMIPLEVIKMTPPAPVGHASARHAGRPGPLESAPPTRAAPAAPPAKHVTLTPLEKKYIHALASGNFSRRHKAKRALLALGTPALPALRQALADASSPQMRGAMAGLISKLKLMRLMQPTYVTLHLKHASLKKIIRQISAQSHVRLTLFNNMVQANGRFNFNETHQPFWQAMIDLQKKTSFGLPRYQYGPAPAGGLPLMLVGNDPPPSSIRGPFIAQAIMFQRNSTLELSSDPAQQMKPNCTFSLQMLFACEPRMPVLQGGALVIDKAVTDTGKSIFKPGVDSTNLWFNPMAGGSGSGFVNFQTVRHMGRRLRILKGHFSCLVASDVTVLKLKDVFHPKKTRHSTHGITVVFSGLNHVNNQYTATIVLVNPSGASPLSAVPPPPGQPVYNQNIVQQQANYMGNTAALLGANGQPLIRQFSSCQFTPANTTVTITWNTNGAPGLPAPGAPKELNLSIPLAFHMVKAPFVFRNLPLP